VINADATRRATLGRAAELAIGAVHCDKALLVEGNWRLR
jgi:hypothetical protein